MGAEVALDGGSNAGGAGVERAVGLGGGDVGGLSIMNEGYPFTLGEGEGGEKGVERRGEEGVWEKEKALERPQPGLGVARRGMGE